MLCLTARPIAAIGYRWWLLFRVQPSARITEKTFVGSLPVHNRRALNNSRWFAPRLAHAHTHIHTDAGASVCRLTFNIGTFILENCIHVSRCVHIADTNRHISNMRSKALSPRRRRDKTAQQYAHSRLRTDTNSLLTKVISRPKRSEKNSLVMTVRVFVFFICTLATRR